MSFGSRAGFQGAPLLRFGDVWAWTSSMHAPDLGYRPWGCCSSTAVQRFQPCSLRKGRVVPRLDGPLAKLA
jgi:hypothetical protein